MLKAQLVLFLSALTLAVASLSPVAWAAIGTSGYSVSPVKIVLDANAGESKTATVSLANLHKDTLIKLGVHYYNFTPQLDGSPKIDLSTTLPTGITTWLKGPDTFLLNAGQNDAYIATITVPKNATAGAYYGVVAFNNQDNINDSAVGVNVIINVGTVTKKLVIESIDTAGLQVTNQWRALGQVDLVIKGSGSGYFVPEKMILELLDANKNTIESLEANSSQGGLLPGSSRKFTVPVDKLLTPNQPYSVRAKVYTAANTDPVTAEASIKTPAITATNTKTPATPSPQSKPKTNLFFILGTVVAAALLTMLVLFLLHDRKKKRFASTPPVRTATLPNLMPISSLPPSNPIAPQAGQYTPQPPASQLPTNLPPAAPPTNL
jgi:hypothetical protein